jgi:hypothetical protein
MKKSIILLSIFSAWMFLFNQCTTGKNQALSKQSQPEEMLLKVAQKTWKDCTAAQLESGKNIYTTKCTTCHAMKSISNRSEEAWREAISTMAPKARLLPEEIVNLTIYILSARQL